MAAAAIKYCRQSTGSDTTGDGSSSNPYATYAHAEEVHRGQAVVIALFGGEITQLTGSQYLRLSQKGDSKSECGGITGWFLDGATPVIGISGTPHWIQGDYGDPTNGSNLAPGITVVANRWYSAPKNAHNKCWYQVVTAGVLGSSLALSTVDGELFTSGTAQLRCRLLIQPTSANAFNYTKLVSCNSGDTPNNCKLQYLGFRNGRGTAFNSGQGSSYPLLYIEFTDNLCHELADAFMYTVNNNLTLNNEFKVNRNVVRHCGKVARDSNFNDGGGSGFRPGIVRLRGNANTTGLTREFNGNQISKSWQEILITAQGVTADDNFFQGLYTGFYPVTPAANVIGHTGPQKCTIRRPIVIGSNDPEYQRSGESGYGVMTSSESATNAPITELKVSFGLFAFIKGGLYISGGGGTYATFKDSDFVFCTVVDCVNNITAAHKSQNTGSRIKCNAFINSPYVGPALTTIDCDYNGWDSEAAAGNMAAANDTYFDTDGPALIKKLSGTWSSISEPTDITYADFQPGNGSSLEDAGLTISGYTTDFLGNTLGSPPWLGAIHSFYDTPTGGGGGNPATPSIYDADTTTNPVSAGTDRTVPRPNNLVAANAILLHFHAGNSAATSGSNVSNVDDFTSIGFSRGTGSTFRPESAAYIKQGSNSEPANYTFDAAASLQAYALRIDGHDPADPIGSTSSADSGGTSVSTYDVPGITTAENNASVVIVVTTRSGGCTNFACAGTDRKLYEASPNGVSSYAAFTLKKATAGATGDFTVTWTGSSRVSIFLYEINPGTAADILAPEFIIQPYLVAGENSVEVKFSATDDSTIKAYAAVMRVPVLNPDSGQTIDGTDGSGIDAIDTAENLSVTDSTLTTLTLDISSITAPIVKIAIVLADDATPSNIQPQPVILEVLRVPPSGTKYTRVTINKGEEAANSFLSGVNFALGDIEVYPSVTNEDALEIDISGAGDIDIDRDGNTNSQTFEGNVYSRQSGSSVLITFQDPFYQALIGPFGNNTGTKQVSKTLYVVAALTGVPVHFDPYNIRDYIEQGYAVSVDVNASGIGTFYNTVPGSYYGYVFNEDGSFQGVLGHNGAIGVTVA